MVKADPNNRLCTVIISPQVSITEAIAQLDRAGIGALLLCDANQKLTGILTDGDIRRAILRGVSFKDNCDTIACHTPVVASPELTQGEALHMMDRFDVNHLPVVDTGGKLVDLILRRDIIKEEQLSLSAVIMAGGPGTRLRPLTKEIPKPMLPLGDRPLMQRIIEQLSKAGIRRVNITTHYQAEKIVAYFGDGRKFGVELNYVNEDRPLGTVGALGLMAPNDEPILMINGDILTGVNFRAMLDYHRQHKADLTVAVRKYDLHIPYGVMECEGPRVCMLREKPQVNFLVNAGIYLLQPSVHQYIPTGKPLDMTDLIQCLLNVGRLVVSFPIMEYWLDIGQHADYERAQEDIKNGRL